MLNIDWRFADLDILEIIVEHRELYDAQTVSLNDGLAHGLRTCH